MIRIDLTARHGERKFRYRFESSGPRVILAGPSGSGKTTLLRTIVGVQPAIGEIEIDGNFLIDTSRDLAVETFRRRIGWVPQEHDLFPHLNVRSNLTFGGEAHFDQVVDALELSALLDRHPRNLSGGEKQRVALGRALLCSPKLLLLDEPFSALNETLRERVLRCVIERCDADGMHAILCAHNRHGLESFSEEIWHTEDL